jgi:hypothetical protein
VVLRFWVNPSSKDLEAPTKSPILSPKPVPEPASRFALGWVLSALGSGRNDQHRSAGMLGDLVRDASRELLADAFQTLRAQDNHRRVDLVRDVDDALPERLLELGPRLGLEPCLPRANRAGPGFLQRAVRVQVLESVAWDDGRDRGDPSAAVSVGPMSTTTARRGPRSAAAASIALSESTEPS